MIWLADNRGGKLPNGSWKTIWIWLRNDRSCRDFRSWIGVPPRWMLPLQPTRRVAMRTTAVASDPAVVVEWEGGGESVVSCEEFKQRCDSDRLAAALAELDG